MEEDLFFDHFSNSLSDEIFCFNTEKKLKQNLKKYLEVGKFYTRKKINTRNYFLNINGQKNKDTFLYKTLSDLSRV